MKARNPRLSARGLVSWGALLLSALWVGPGSLAAPPGESLLGHQGTPRVSDPANPKLQPAMNLRPLFFIPHQGQTEAGVRFSAQGRGFGLSFAPREISLSLAAPDQDHIEGPTRVRLIPLNLNPGVELLGLKQRGVVHYYLGNNPKLWREHVPAYQAVLYREAYPGIDLQFYGAGSHLEYDLIVKPGADLSRVRFQCRGVQDLQVNPAGDLVLRLPNGLEILQAKPWVYQEVDGRQVAREGRFCVSRRGAQPTYGFAVAAYDSNRPLVIDPVLIFATYLGGSQADGANAMALDQNGRIWVTGETRSGDFPSKPPAGTPGGADVFVTRFLDDGTLDFATVLGGSQDDSGQALALDWDGAIYLTGKTASADFPTNNAFQTVLAGSADAFVARLYGDGTLDYATYLGGKGDDGATGIAVDHYAYAYVTGQTSSPDFPLVHPLPGGAALKGTTDAFVARIEPPFFFIDPVHFIYIWFPANLAYSTYLGGSGEEESHGLALDQADNVYLTGSTSSPDFPLVRELSGMQGATDAFVTMLKPDGSLNFSTLLGGRSKDCGYGIAVDQEGSVYVTGLTESPDFPTTANALQKSVPNPRNAFLVKMKPPANDPPLPAKTVYSTYLGGTELLDAEIHCQGRGIAVDKAGNAYVAGYTNVPSFPTAHPLQAFMGLDDAWISKISYDPVSDRMSLAFSTFLGGHDKDQAYGLAVDKLGNIYVAGATQSPDFPVWRAAQPVLAGDRDALVAKISLVGPSALPFLPLLLE